MTTANQKRKKGKFNSIVKKARHKSVSFFTIIDKVWLLSHILLSILQIIPSMWWIGTNGSLYF